MGLIMTNTNLLPSLIHRIILKIDQHLPKIQTVSQYGDIFYTEWPTFHFLHRRIMRMKLFNATLS